MFNLCPLLRSEYKFTALIKTQEFQNAALDTLPYTLLIRLMHSKANTLINQSATCSVVFTVCRIIQSMFEVAAHKANMQC